MRSQKSSPSFYWSILGMVCLLGVTMWIIRSEGERFRGAAREIVNETMHEGVSTAVTEAGKVAKEVTTQAGEEARGVVREVVRGAEDLVDKVAEVPGKIVDTVAPAQERDGRSSDTVGESKPNDIPNSASELPSASKSTGDDSTSSTDDPSKPSPKQEAASTKPGDLIADVFKIGQGVSKAADDFGQRVFGLDAEQERVVGRQVHARVQREKRLVKDSSIQRRLQLLAAPLLEKRERKEITYHFEVVDDIDVNAFAHLGGYIHVTTGLLKFVESDRELQFVMAHEIAHVDLKHCVGKLTYAARAGQVTGDLGEDLAGLAYHLISSGYSEESEFEADRWAYLQLRKLGCSHADAVQPMIHLDKLSPSRDSRSQTSGADGIADRVVREVENHLSTHPPTIERIRRLERLSGTPVQ